VCEGFWKREEKISNNEENEKRERVRGVGRMGWFFSPNFHLTHSKLPCATYTQFPSSHQTGDLENIIASHTRINVVVVGARVVLLLLNCACPNAFISLEKSLTQWIDGRKAITQHTFALSGWQ
jgi:hypothetical protein